MRSIAKFLGEIIGDNIYIIGGDRFVSIFPYYIIFEKNIDTNFFKGSKKFFRYILYYIIYYRCEAQRGLRVKRE